MGLIDYEVEEVSKLCQNILPRAKLVTCINTLVRVEFHHSVSKQAIACLRFPDNYPHMPLLTELKSKTLCSKLLGGLTTLCDQEAKSILGKPQILVVLKTIDKYLVENPLCIVFGEVQSLRRLLASNDSGGEIKLSQKKCCCTLIARGGAYFFKVKVSVPDDYPQTSISWDDHDSNLPDVLVRFLNGQAKEFARQCVEPPLRPHPNAHPFEAQTSLEKTLQFLIAATRDFHQEQCPICKLPCLPSDATEVVLDDAHDNYVERVYCGHLFHQGCLKQYMREPPFPVGGKCCPAAKTHPRSDAMKKAPGSSTTSASRKAGASAGPTSSVCGVRLSHDRWGLNVKLAEARWAQQQARVRELEEVIDFMK